MRNPKSTVSILIDNLNFCSQVNCGAIGSFPVPTISRRQQWSNSLIVPEIAKQLSRPGAQVTRSSSGSGLGLDTGHWAELTG